VIAQHRYVSQHKAEKEAKMPWAGQNRVENPD
jgi:hypothetical protein